MVLENKTHTTWKNVYNRVEGTNIKDEFLLCTTVYRSWVKINITIKKGFKINVIVNVKYTQISCEVLDKFWHFLEMNIMLLKNSKFNTIQSRQYIKYPWKVSNKIH